jgi:heptosyltransferase-2
MENKEQESLRKILVIQTAFPGDVILATGLIESLHNAFPQASLDVLVRKGNEVLFEEHPYLSEILILDKKKGKLKAISAMASLVRKKEYDLLINLHRFGSSGFIAMYSGARRIVGFSKNPFSFAYTKRFPHALDGRHETERNFLLIQDLKDVKYCKPKLYPSANHYKKVSALFDLASKFVCIAPSSVWFTKELPESKWMELVNFFPPQIKIVFIGAPSDRNKCDRIIAANPHPNCINLAGKISLIESAALMQQAQMVYANDSAPLHLATSVNAPSSAFFLSTVPKFGFTGLSTKANVFECIQPLACRPCGLHGHRACPKGHFKCAIDLEITKEMATL